MKRTALGIGLFVSTALLLSVPATATSPVVPPPNPNFINASNEFALETFTRLGIVETRNVLVSPTSFSAAMSMLLNGAADETQTALRNGLGYANFDTRTINEQQALLNALLTDSKDLSIANSLWLRKEANIKPAFSASVRKYYRARISTLDFANPKSVGIINNWVKANTKGKIPKIIDSISPDMHSFIINALYFKGAWAKPFEPATIQPFYLLNGERKDTPTLTQSGNYPYMQTDMFSAVALPYKNNMRMLIFAPKKVDGMRDIVGSMTAKNWQNWRNQFKTQEGSVSLPKFKFGYSIDLRNIWSGSIMAPIFQAGANFSAMTNQDVHISEVQHITMIEVNEKGTEAAAVTSIGVRATSINMTPPFEFKADRPFVFAIEDSRTGALVFLGTVLSL